MGVNYVIISVYGNWARSQDAAAEAAGLWRAYYWENGPLPEWIPEGSMVWLAVEDGSRFIDWSTLYHGTVEVMERGFQAGIYTSQHYWQKLVGGDDFADLPLWDARYPYAGPHPENLPLRPAEMDLGSFVPYGGWEQPHTWQCRGSNTFAGIWCDLNYRSS